MGSFLDVFGARRRQAPRVAVAWQVEIGPPQTQLRSVYQSCNVSRWGLRLQGGSAEEFRALLSDEGGVVLLVRLPGCEDRLEVEAELRWGLGGEAHFVSGWRFTRIAHAAQQALDEYIAAHPEQVVHEPLWG
jgi:hypothetical protein